VIMAVAIPMVLVYTGRSWTEAGAVAAGCLVGVVITPDLDVRHQVRSHEVIRRAGGCLAGALWSLLWWPYSRLIPYHRHWLSHTPIIGTSLRAAYIGLIVYGVVRLIGLDVLLPWWFTWSMAGLLMADAMHWLMDQFGSGG